MLIRISFVVAVIVCLAASAFGEYYQYRDEKGVLRFTDDLSTVPPDQRPEVKTRISIESESELPANNTTAEEETSTPGTSEEVETPAVNSSKDGQNAQQVEELNRMQAELKKAHQALQDEQAALRAKAPPETASYTEKAAYNKEVDAYNAKIVDYETQLDAFNKKVEGYNEQVKK